MIRGAAPLFPAAPSSAAPPRRSSPGRLATHAWLALLVCAAGCGAGAGAAGAEASSPARAEPRDVRTTLSREVPWERRLRAVADLVPWERAVISAKVPGRVVELAFDLGTRVHRGDVLARVDPLDYELRLAQAEAAVLEARALLGLAADGDSDALEPTETPLVRAAQAELEQAELAFGRAQELEREGVASKANFDAARAELSVAQARQVEALEEIERRRAMLAQRRTSLAVARAQLADSTIVAPFDGIAGERLVGHGQYVESDAPLTELVSVDPLRARSALPERAAGSVRPGQAISLWVEGDEREHRGTIARIAPALDPGTRTLLVEAEIPQPPPRAGASDQPELRPGSFARMEIVLAEDATALVVPPSAVVSFAGVDRVFEVEAGPDGPVARGRRVEVGRRDEQRVEITSGLAPGVPIVLDPGDLVDGAPVRPSAEPGE